MMKRLSVFAIALAGVISLFLTATTAGAAEYVAKTKQCPVTGANLLPVGGNYNLEDVIISTDGATDIELHWNPPKITLLRLYMSANETVVMNFSDNVEAPEEDQGLNLTCGGTATVSITIVGTEKL
jgi:hypothetical protein